jgi:protein-disulfide isomerase
LVQLASEAGMSASDADRCIAATTDDDAISKVGEDGVAKYAVNATPTFVINGQSQAGFDTLTTRIDAALAGN